MRRSRDIEKERARAGGELPFGVPEGYFDHFEERLRARMESDERGSDGRDSNNSGPEASIFKLKIRPFVSLAAAIAGFALISFTVLRLITGGVQEEPFQYDLTVLEQNGMLQNEHVIMEVLDGGDVSGEEEFTEWEEEAMNYLASNDVDLEILLSEMN